MSRPKPTERRLDRFVLWSSLALGAILRFTNIAKASVWHDEGYTMMLAPQSPGQIWLRTGRDVHPPLYYLTLHYWISLFGTSETAIRSLSAVLMLGVIVTMFLLVKRLFGSQAARLTAIFLAVAPFLVRYSQEARMYGMLAFIAALATYLLIRALESRKTLAWVCYALAIAAGLYTYYYVLFLIVFHWVYVAFLSVYSKLSWASVRQRLLDPKWIGANALAVVLWLPWVPTAYVQLTKIQSPPWIPKATLQTLPVSFGQFMTFTDVGGHIGNVSLVPWRDGLFVVFIVLVGLWLYQKRQQLAPRILMALYMGLTPLLVWLLSLGAHPKYVDRYFVFAAVAFYAVLAIMFTEAWPWRGRRIVQAVSVILTVGTLLVGVRNVYSQATHAMRPLAEHIKLGARPGDAFIAGDFYTYFDFRYYSQRDNLPGLAQVYVPGDFPGCCEGRSLLYDQPQLVVKDFGAIHPASGYAWIVGRPGSHDYFDQLPSSWIKTGSQFIVGDMAVQRYRVIP